MYMDELMTLKIQRHPIIGLILLGLAMALMTPLSHASTYKWEDDSGNTHYTQHPPKGRPYTKLKSKKHRPATPAKPVTASPTTTGNSGNTGSGNSVGEKALKLEMAKNEKQRKDNCKTAKENLHAYSVYRRIRQADGTVVSLTDKERNSRKKRSETAVREFCN